MSRRSQRTARSAHADRRRRSDLPLAALALAAAAFAGLALLLYAPCFDGPFLSDDQHYLAHNPYVHTLSVETVLETLRPAGAVTRQVENYAPIHVLLHAVAWQVFGSDVRGHHVVNVLLHALVATLLVALFVRDRVLGLPAALFAGGVFLVHPANVEAVAWMSQLKSPSSLALALLALLAHPRRPGWGVALFGLALLAKPIAAFALPFALVRAWVRTAPAAADPEAAARERRSAAWLAGWGLVLLGFAVAELSVFEAHSGGVTPTYPDPFVRAWTAVALLPRYFWMALTGLGTSAFHEPLPVPSPLAPAALLGALVALLLGWRALLCLRRRNLEAACWVWAAAAYFPVSQIFPFPFPMADRYLYFVLPGLLGGLLLAGRDALDRAGGVLAARGTQQTRAFAAAAVLAVALLGAQAHARAGLWTSSARLAAESAVNYPHGTAASILRARAAARAGDVPGVQAALAPMIARGYNRFDTLLKDPSYAPLRGDPRFEGLLRLMATRWVERIHELEHPTQPDLHMLALAHMVRGEEAAAAGALRRGLELGGPFDERFREELAALETPGGARAVVRPPRGR